MSNTSREELADRLERVRNRLTGADIAEICAALRSQGSGNGGAEAVAAYIDDLERHGTIEHEVAFEIKRRLPPSEPSQRSKINALEINEQWQRRSEPSQRGEADEATRNEVRNDPTISPTVKRAMEHFWKLSDQYAAPAPKCEAGSVEVALRLCEHAIIEGVRDLGLPSVARRFEVEFTKLREALSVDEPQTSQEPREALEERLARAARVARDFSPDTLYQHLGDDYPIDFTDTEGRTFYLSWRKELPAVRAVLAALSPTPTGPG